MPLIMEPGLVSNSLDTVNLYTSGRRYELSRQLGVGLALWTYPTENFTSETFHEGEGPSY